MISITILPSRDRGRSPPFLSQKSQPALFSLHLRCSFSSPSHLYYCSKALSNPEYLPPSLLLQPSSSLPVVSLELAVPTSNASAYPAAQSIAYDYARMIFSEPRCVCGSLIPYTTKRGPHARHLTQVLSGPSWNMVYFGLLSRRTRSPPVLHWHRMPL